MGLEAVLVAIAGFIGSFVSTLVSNGSSVTLPALELFGLSEHVANGTNRLSVVALGLVGIVSFAREGLIDWRKGAWIAALIASGTIVGSLVVTRLSDAVLDAIVIAGLLLVLGMCSSSDRAAGSGARKERPDRSTGARRPPTSPSASTPAWSSSARASSCSPRWSCSRATIWDTGML
jgi:uncharacterized membrane protein YfcA